ncbi:type I-E CRISPR-associated protein Cse1/CasA [Haloglycomyces albus]|uniref:type I-E CRISPR-associated protein Cse1/CasA n=1 Tax=Haloglycomyces albus TaxID=526067 RepID=UPI00046CE34F|nr:type I-E CRISPR-associated protein Cse1/CasA [Haloglycomyces albus]
MFNVVIEPFIPVTYHGESQPRHISITQLIIDAHLIVDVHGPSPVAESGLLRLLYAFTWRIATRIAPDLADIDLACDEPRTWFKVRNDLLEAGRFPPEAIDEYFTASGHCWDLVDNKRPFLQDKRLADDCVSKTTKKVKGQKQSTTTPVTSGINKLEFERRSGNNEMLLFSHHTNHNPTPLSLDEGFWAILSQLNYAAGGKNTPRVISSGVAKSEAFNAPARRGISFHPWGKNLYTTLIAGLPAFDDTFGRPDPHLPFPWETADVAPVGPQLEPVWPHSAWTRSWTHAVLLVPDSNRTSFIDGYLTTAVTKNIKGAPDPYMVWEEKKNDTAPRKMSTGRALWRELDAVLTVAPRRRQPSVITDLAKLPSTLRSQFGIRTYALASDQARNDQWDSVTFPGLTHYLEQSDPTAAGRFARTVMIIEQVGRTLERVAYNTWVAISGNSTRKNESGSAPWKMLTEPVMAAYWEHAENLFWSHISTNDDDTVWNAVVRSAFESLASLLHHHRRTHPGAAALADAWSRLWAEKPRQPKRS